MGIFRRMQAAGAGIDLLVEIRGEERRVAFVKGRVPFRLELDQRVLIRLHALRTGRGRDRNHHRRHQTGS